MEVEKYLLLNATTQNEAQSSVPLIFSPTVLKVGVQDNLVQESGTLENDDNVVGVDLDRQGSPQVMLM